jgi:para-aminobenzoate synthetase/4-amino-4-deoxychorismate lyase
MTRRHPVPAEVHALVEQTPATVLLEGRTQGNSKANENSWTQLLTAPLRVCVAHSLAEIPPLFAAIEDAVAAGHYAAGFFTYECGTCFEPTANTHALPQNQPLAWFGIYDRSYVFDHSTGEFTDEEPPQLPQFRANAQSAAANSPQPPEPPPPPEISAEFALTESAYAERIAAIHNWIRAGDVYQINFTAPFRVEARGTVAAHYARLRERQPVDYGAFLHCQPGRHILSFSPELFFRIETDGSRCGDRHIVARPMKGTARRGRTTREDREIAHWLANDPKNRSENLMIVDLVRNDLGRIARFGTVRAENLFAVERYPTLWQMTSTVSADLQPDARFYDIFRALFPCGSITGAPKVRAMQLIAELEASPRGVYTGAIGFFSPRQTVFNVAIRTLQLEEIHGVFGAGSGVVIDSDPAAEYRECLLKAEFLTRSEAELPEQFSLIETMLWADRSLPGNLSGGYPLIELHLDRLADSADYFDFPCDRAAVKTALNDHARQFADTRPHPAHRVRLLLGSDGEVQITSEVLPPRNNCLQATNELLQPPDNAPQIMNEPLATGFEPHSPQNCHPERSTLGAPDSQCESGVSGAKDLLLHSLAAPSASAEPVSAPLGRVRIAPQRTDPDDPMLYHKTTHRPLYAQAFADALRDGFDDVLFLNLRGEVTEGAISNLFIEKDGRWFTPPIECGLLAGVYRRHLLETRPDIQERALHEEDLRTAAAIYLCNAVRGLRRVEISWQENSSAVAGH